VANELERYQGKGLAHGDSYSFCLEMTIDLRPDVHSGLASQADARSRDVRTYAARLLEQAAEHRRSESGHLSIDELERTLDRIARFSHEIPVLPDEAFFAREPISGSRVSGSRQAGSLDPTCALLMFGVEPISEAFFCDHAIGRTQHHLYELTLFHIYGCLVKSKENCTRDPTRALVSIHKSIVLCNADCIRCCESIQCHRF